MLPELFALYDPALLALRVLIAVLFFTSGWSHATKTKERSESVGMSPGATFVLGVVEMAGALSVLVGFLPQLGALLLMGVMVGAMHKKMFVWKTGFWGEKSNGWFYDALYFVANAVILASAGGAYTVT